jgi:hypothetical protein
MNFTREDITHLWGSGRKENCELKFTFKKAATCFPPGY